MNDSFGGGGFNANATTSGAGGSETQKDGILPCCIRQLLLVNDDVQMFGLSYAMVTVIAIVRKIDYTSTKITYTLEDHTGRMEAHYWLDDENAAQPKITQNAYAKIIGSLRNAGDNKVIIVYHAEEVEKIGEVTTHLLEVLYSRFQAEQYQKGGGDHPNYKPIDGGKVEEKMETNQEEEKEHDNPFALQGKHLVVFRAIKAHGNQGTVGLDRRALQTKFSHISKPELDSIIDYMCTEGIIYTTIDSDHFLTVD